jgi:hypothetical protein
MLTSTLTPAEARERVSTIEHRGRSVLYIDYRDTTGDAMNTILDEAVRRMRASSGGLLTLDDFRGASATRTYMPRVRESSAVLKAKRVRAAALGITGAKSTILRMYNLFSSDKVVPFDGMNEALDYLTKEERRS